MLNQWTLLAGAILLAGMSTCVPSPGVPLRPLRTIPVDDSAWHHNIASFDQDKIVSFDDFQYCTYWDSNKRLICVRRRLGTNLVERHALPYTLSTNPDDGHRNSVVGISPLDGRLHLSWDHHNNPLRYTHSTRNFLKEPPEALAAEQFEPKQPLLPDDELETRVTYPRFLNDSENTLYFVYRQGASGSGDTYIHTYDTASEQWRRLGDTGLFSRKGVYPAWNNSNSRNAYLNGMLFDGRGRLHTTWTYREAGRTWASNHDLHYAYSDDHGITWRNNSGQVIARIDAGDPVMLDDPGIVVRHIPVFSWLMNQTAMAIDSTNQPHVITYHAPAPMKPETLKHSPPPHIAKQLRMFHYWRDDLGNWQGGKPIVPLTTRPGILLTDDDTLIVYYAQGGDLAVHWAHRDTNWQDWQSSVVKLPQINLQKAGKPDKRLLRQRGVLSFAAQTRPTEGGSGFAIVDMEITGRAQ